MNHGKELFDQVISTIHIEPISMDFKYPNKAMKNFLEKNYGIMISITHVDNFNKIDYYDLINKQFNEFVDKYYAFNNYYNYNNFNPFNNCYNRLYESNSKPKNRFYLNNNNKNNINDSGEMNNKKYDNIENNYIKGFNTDKNNYFINNINKNNEKPKLLRNNSCFDSNRNKDNNNHYLNDENRHMANILNPNINNPNNNMVSRNKYEENNFKYWPTSNISQNNIILNYDKEEQQKNYEINKVLEDTFIQGEKTKYELRKEKIRHPEKFIDTSQALKMEEKDQGIFALGLISKNLENLGIENAIMKDSNPNEENKNFNSIQLLINGMTHKKKYDLHFDFGKERNKELLKNKNEYKKFEEKLKSKICNDFKIPSDKIVIALSKKNGFHVQLIFQSDEFNNLDKEDFTQKFKDDPNFPELKNLKDIQVDTIIGAIKLSPNQLDPKGNRTKNWAINQQRGGKDYIPPLGWTGIGLKVEDRYDNGDNTWLGMKNSPGEWCVAYHGVGNKQESDNVKYIVGEIIKNEFKAGPGQRHKDCPDAFHPKTKKKVGERVYCTPQIKAAEKYAGKSNINGINYKTVIMVRVKPNALRHCSKCSDSRKNNYWVVNGTNDEIRPYRILYKKC